MNKSNSLKLLNAFPSLYRGFLKPVDGACLCWRFECHDGWFQIIWDLSMAVEEQARKEGRGEANWPKATQVKEKFGTLRFYMDDATDVMWDLVEAAEEKSAHLCEICGEPGQTYNDTWINTSCDSCRPIP